MTRHISNAVITVGISRTLVPPSHGTYGALGQATVRTDNACVTLEGKRAATRELAQVLSAKSGLGRHPVPLRVIN